MKYQNIFFIIPSARKEQLHNIFNKSHLLNLIDYIKNKKIETLTLNKKTLLWSLFYDNKNDYFELIEKYGIKIKNKEINYLIIISEWGVETYNQSIKKFKQITAMIDTEVQAGLAMEHNNATVIIFNKYTLSKKGILACLEAFFSSKFQGARHTKRLQLIEKERK